MVLLGKSGETNHSFVVPAVELGSVCLHEFMERLGKDVSFVFRGSIWLQGIFPGDWTGESENEQTLFGASGTLRKSPFCKGYGAHRLPECFAQMRLDEALDKNGAASLHKFLKPITKSNS